MDKRDQKHPDRDQLESFVHGKLPDELRQDVEDHVAECNVCCELLRSISHNEQIDIIRTAVDGRSEDGGWDDGNGAAETQLLHPRNARHEDDTDGGATGEAGAEAGAEAGGDVDASMADAEWEPSEDLKGIPPELAQHPRYRIVRTLGAGGMGVVYEAEHRLMERRVALKVVSAKLVSNDVAIDRFRLEVKAAARLSHRNIVAAFDAEQAGDLHFLVMEFIEGTSLAELVGRRGRISVLHACNYVSQVAQGLQHAFENGTVHRDIKPHNLMRTPKGTIKILDFGLARFASHHPAASDETGLTGDDTILGTPDYMAPEQARDARHADIRADIYSLGCTLYYLLSGRVPFPKGTAIEKVVAHCERDAESLQRLRTDVPNPVVDIVVRMMAKTPADRFQTPSEVVDALKPFSKPKEGWEQPLGAGLANSLPGQDTSSPNVRDQHIPDQDVPDQDVAVVPTYVDVGATLPPLEVLDPFAVAQQDLAPPRPKPVRRKFSFAQRRPETGWVLLAVVGAALFLLAIVASTRSWNSDWIDLLAEDVPREPVIGTWGFDVEGAVGSDPTSATLAFSYEPPAEFDFEVTFTRHSGSDSIAVHFPAGSGDASFDIDGWFEHVAGIQNIDGETTKRNATRVENQQLVNGQEYTALVRVRQGRVDAYLDGTRIASYQGDGSRLAVPELWRMPRSAFGVSVYNGRATFHRVRILPLNH
jgi:serine/threonine protein kinase